MATRQAEFDDKLYSVTNNQKDVYSQMKADGHVEICGMSKGKWMRVRGVVSEDPRREARVAMMDANEKARSSMYTVDDNLMTVFFFEQSEATLYSFTDSPQVYEL